VQEQWQQWEQRVNKARSQIKAYAQAPELSAPQRQQAIENYLTSQFQGTELIRARALLGV
jgi:capsule polysaccharide export protein KpsE/RkpR